MTIDEIDEFIHRLDGVLLLAPEEGDGTPEIAWGDRFYYYAPDGVIPPTQPFATIVTKDYPEDTASHLDRPGAFRLNIGAGSAAFAEHAAPVADPSVPDVVFAHPLYARQHFLAVVNPGPASWPVVETLLRTAHDLARNRRERRDGV